VPSLSLKYSFHVLPVVTKLFITTLILIIQREKNTIQIKLLFHEWLSYLVKGQSLEMRASNAVMNAGYREFVGLFSSMHTLKISKPAISKIPMKDAPCLFVLSRERLILVTNHLNILS